MKRTIEEFKVEHKDELDFLMENVGREVPDVESLLCEMLDDIIGIWVEGVESGEYIPLEE